MPLPTIVAVFANGMDAGLAEELLKANGIAVRRFGDALGPFLPGPVPQIAIAVSEADAPRAAVLLRDSRADNPLPDDFEPPDGVAPCDGTPPADWIRPFARGFRWTAGALCAAAVVALLVGQTLVVDLGGLIVAGIVCLLGGVAWVVGRAVFGGGES